MDPSIWEHGINCQFERTTGLSFLEQPRAIAIQNVCWTPSAGHPHNHRIPIKPTRCLLVPHQQDFSFNRIYSVLVSDQHRLASPGDYSVSQISNSPAFSQIRLIMVAEFSSGVTPP